MYDVKDVAIYVLAYGKKYCISGLKLQKILYFIQVYFLISLGQACFYNQIEAWEFGPVIPDVYKIYGAGANTIFIHTESVETLNFVNRNHKSLINEVVDTFSIYPAYELTRLTQNQLPWRKAYYSGNKIISLDDLKAYFSGNADEL